MHHLNKHLVHVARYATHVDTEFSDDYGLTWRVDKVFPLFDTTGYTSVDLNLVTALQIAVLTGRDLVL